MKQPKKSENKTSVAAEGDSAADAGAALNGAEMMASVRFEREDIPEESKPRAKWMLSVIRFMRLRRYVDA